MSLTISSQNFANGDLIPSKYTCDGENISPAIKWQNAPKQTKSFVLICDDPDAPRGTWTHWILYNLPPTTLSLAENVASLPNGAKAGVNSWGEKKYGGPCPPSGEHRYIFTLYALDILINAAEELDSKALQRIMQNHVLEKAILMGRYSRGVRHAAPP